MDRFMNRRLFLQLGGMSLGLTVANPSLARRLASRSARDRVLRDGLAKAQTDFKTVVMIYLRGGADGLNQTVPTNDADYPLYVGYRSGLYHPKQPDLSGRLSMSEAGTLLTDVGGADLQWGLSPRMAELMPLWDAGSLVILPDVHYDNASRSHFDSQAFYENGTPGNKFTSSGWINRYLTYSDTGDPLLRGIAFDTLPPDSYRGDYPTLTFSNLSDLSVSGSASRNDRYLSTQEQIYPLTENGPGLQDPRVSVTGQSLIAAIRAIAEQEPLPDPSDLANTLYPADQFNGIYRYFGDRLRDLARLIKSNAFGIQVAEVDLYGWDTHQGQDQAGTYHQHGNLSEALAMGIRGFWEDIGSDPAIGDDLQRNTVIVVMTEFGRTTRQNGSFGTDHGSAMSTFVVGHPGVLDGRRVVHGAKGWAGIAPEQLRQNRDLVHSTDYRDVLAEIVQRHLNVSPPDLFPGHQITPVGLFS